MELTEDEKALYDELIVQIAACFPKSGAWGTVWKENQGRKNRFDFKNCVTGHESMSDFEAGCSVLQDVEASVPINFDGSPNADKKAWSGCFRILFDAEELRRHLAHDLPPSAPPMDEAITAFLGLTTNYDSYPIPTQRAPFTVPEGFELTFACLERCGYVEPTGHQVKWTEKMQPHMRALYHWDEDGRSKVEL